MRIAVAVVTKQYRINKLACPPRAGPDSESVIVSKSKGGTLFHYKSKQKSDLGHFQKQPVVKKEYETLSDIH
jgi:hypothetical protein